MNRSQFATRCSAAAAAAIVIAELAAFPATARPDPGGPIPIRFSSYHYNNCPLERIGTQFVRCDYLTGAGFAPPFWYRSMGP
jgi:hypothetical protein